LSISAITSVVILPLARSIFNTLWRKIFLSALVLISRIN
jgi:hypothetical protein